MATYNGVNKALSLTPTGQNLLGAGLFAGKVRVMIDTYTTHASSVVLEAGDTIEMGGELPVGATVLEVMLTSVDMGTNIECSVGDTASVARYLSTGTDLSSASLHFIEKEEITGRGYTVLMTDTMKAAGEADNQIIITMEDGGTWALGNSKKLILIVFYTI